MGIGDSLGISRSGLQAERLRMDVAANNLANMSSTRSTYGGPYHRQVVLMRAAGGSTGFGATLATQMGGAVPGGGVVDGGIDDQAPPRRVYDPSNPAAGQDRLVLYPHIGTPVELTDM